VSARRFVSLTISDSPADPFALPDVGVMVFVEAECKLGVWLARTVPTADGDPVWAGCGDSLNEAIIRLLAERIGVRLPTCDACCG